MINVSTRQLSDARAIDVALLDTAGNQLSGFDTSRPATAAHTTVPSAAVSTTLLAANPARRSFILWNNSNKTLYVIFGATATLTAFTFVLGPGGNYESKMDDYTGIISGIWNAANGDAQVTEIS